MKPYIFASAASTTINRMVAATYVQLAGEAGEACLAEHERQDLVGQLVRLLDDDHFARFVPADDLRSAAHSLVQNVPRLTWWYSGCSLVVSITANSNHVSSVKNSQQSGR